jgi:hypothetical protein
MSQICWGLRLHSTLKSKVKLPDMVENIVSMTFIVSVYWDISRYMVEYHQIW